MNKQTSLAIAYAQNALSFLLNFNYINSIYLFGSATRGELTKDSDIDLFIDTEKENLVKGDMKEALSRLYLSKDYEKWKLLKFTFPINVHFGKLEEWELKQSIATEGIILFSFKSNLNPIIKKVLFSLELPKDKKKYLKFIRKLFGRKEKNYRDSGLIQEMNGNRLSSTIILIPQTNQTRLMEFLNQQKVKFQMIDFF